MENNQIQIEARLNDTTVVRLCAWERKEFKNIPENLRKQAWPAEDYLRFFIPVTPGLTGEGTPDLAGMRDLNQRVWVALDVARPHQPIIGIARLRRFEDRATAEISGAVDPKEERNGLGRILLAQLYLLAQSEELKSLRLVVSEQNRTTVQWFQRLGATVHEFRDEVIELDLPVYQDAGMLPDNETTRHFRATIDVLEEPCCTL